MCRDNLEKNAQRFFEYGHKSAGEGSSIFFVSEQNPIYATEIQQDFYYPMTTMEYSTRYAKKFSLDRVYWDPVLIKSEFAAEAKETIAKNLELYESCFEILMQRLKEKKAKEELPAKVSVFDSLRFLIPIASYTTVILGGNTRASVELFGKLLSYEDSFTRHFTKSCIEEASKLMPEYFSEIKADPESDFVQADREEFKENAREIKEVAKDIKRTYKDIPKDERQNISRDIINR